MKQITTHKIAIGICETPFHLIRVLQLPSIVKIKRRLIHWEITIMNKLTILYSAN